MTVISRRQTDRIKAGAAARAEMERRRLHLPARPRDDFPELPTDLTELGDADLMNMLAELTRWSDYAAVFLAESEIDNRAAENVLSHIEDVLLIRLMPTSEALRKREDTMTRVKAEVNTHADVQEARQRVLDTYAMRKLAASRAEAFDRDAAVISRELSRRIERDPSERRTHRYAGGR